MSVLASMVVVVIVIVFFGRISDRIGRKPVFVAGAVAQIVLAVPMFLLIQHGGPVGVVIGCVVLGLCLASFAAPTASTLPALFPTAIRYGALSIGFNVAVSAFGGTTPLINEALVGTTGNKLMPGFYLIASGMIGLVTLLFLKESATQPLAGSPPLVSNHPEAQQLSTDTQQMAPTTPHDKPEHTHTTGEDG